MLASDIHCYKSIYELRTSGHEEDHRYDISVQLKDLDRENLVNHSSVEKSKGKMLDSVTIFEFKGKRDVEKYSIY